MCLLKALDCGKIVKLEKQADFTKTKMDQLAKDVNEANDTLDQIMKNRSSDIENMENKISSSLVSISFTFHNFLFDFPIFFSLHFN